MRLRVVCIFYVMKVCKLDGDCTEEEDIDRGASLDWRKKNGNKC